MRKHVYYLSALLIALSAFGSGSFETEDIEENTATAENPVNKNKGPLGDVLFKDTVFMFGDVKDGESVQHTYTFKNTGVAPISIANGSPMWVYNTRIHARGSGTGKIWKGYGYF